MICIRTVTRNGLRRNIRLRTFLAAFLFFREDLKISLLNIRISAKTMEIVIIANNKETNYINSFINITNKNIATVKGYSIIEDIKQDFPQIKNIKEYETPLEGLKDLSNSRIDYFILDIPSFEFYSKKYGLSNLKIVGPTGYNYKYGFGVKKDDTKLVPILNKLLENIPSSKKDEIYRNG